EHLDAAVRLEGAGYRAAWNNEGVGGADALVRAGLMLAETDRLVLATGIATIWARAAQTAHGAASTLAEAYPGRFLLGLGCGYPEQAASAGQQYARPVETMRAYLGQMTLPPWAIP